MPLHNWIDLKRNPQTGIETLRAHFTGHAYDPHWHDSYLVGFTEQGIQQFNCQKKLQTSTTGCVFLLNPSEIHDGNAPTAEGFTYQMLYISPSWLQNELTQLFEETPDNHQLSFDTTLKKDNKLTMATSIAFSTLHLQEIEIAQQAALDNLLVHLTKHTQWRKKTEQDIHLPSIAKIVKEYLHDNLHKNINLNDLTKITQIDRFKISRAFKKVFGITPHAYLVQLRLSKARYLLSQGQKPIDVAVNLSFADQSHLGRWFKRVYQLTPADYRKYCTNLPD